MAKEDEWLMEGFMSLIQNLEEEVSAYHEGIRGCIY